MEIKFEHNSFGKRLKSMLSVDFRRMFTMPLLYIMVGVCLVMPILILIMTTMMDGTVSVNPQTGAETVMEGFDNAWQIIGSVSGDAAASSEAAAMGMSITSMCNINMLYFLAAVLVCIFVADDFRSGYAKNLFTVRANKSDYVISKTLVCFVGGAFMILAFFIGSLLGGAISGLPFDMAGFGVNELVMCILSKMILISVFVPIYLVMSVITKQKLWLSLILSFMVWCLKIPFLIRFFNDFKDENKYARRWLEDARLRVNVSLYGSLIFNTAYAVFQLGLGFYHSSFWFFSMAGYYISLAVMRFFLARHTSKHKPGDKIREELVRYRACGIIFLVMNSALSLMIFFMVYWNRTFIHHEITTIAMAAYTFTSLTLAIVNSVKYRKYNSPVYSASKAISLAAACVSMLTLESTMLTTFGDETMDLSTRRIMLWASGGVVSVFIIAMAVYMIVRGSRKIKLLKAVKE